MVYLSRKTPLVDDNPNNATADMSLNATNIFPSSLVLDHQSPENIPEILLLLILLLI